YMLFYIVDESSITTLTNSLSQQPSLSSSQLKEHQFKSRNEVFAAQAAQSRPSDIKRKRETLENDIGSRVDRASFMDGSNVNSISPAHKILKSHSNGDIPTSKITSSSLFNNVSE